MSSRNEADAGLDRAGASVAGGAGLRCDLGSERVLRREPGVTDLGGHREFIQRLDQDLTATHELSAHDVVLCMRRPKGPPGVLHVRAEMLRRVLVLEALDAGSVGLAEVKPDHHVVEDSVDEGVDDSSQDGLTADVVEVTHAEQCEAYGAACPHSEAA